MSVLFITGIDTDIGKTYATGYLARQIQDNQPNTVITQKLVQTGCIDIAEDLLIHREMMGISLQEMDIDGTTCPYVFPVPASPHLAAELAGQPIDINVITQSTKMLLNTYDTVLLEGAGGLMVPITDELLTIDYLAQHRYPTVLVTSGRLGSINHTLLSLEAFKQRDIPLHMMVYNNWQNTDMDMASKDDVARQIADSTRDYLKNYLATYYPKAQWLELPIF